MVGQLLEGSPVQVLQVACSQSVGLIPSFLSISSFRALTSHMVRNLTSQSRLQGYVYRAIVLPIPS